MTRSPVSSVNFRWNPTAARYVTPGGRFVSEREIVRAAEQAVNLARDEMRSLAARVAAGDIEIGEWQVEMAAKLKTLHLASYVAGRGGFASMGQEDYGRIGAILRFQYGRLARFALRIEQGYGEAAILRRAGMYADSGRRTYWRASTEARRAAHFDEERRVLGVAEHCPDCLEYAAMGWQPLGSLPLIGDSRCLTNCRCRFEYRRVEAEIDSINEDFEPAEDDALLESL